MILSFVLLNIVLFYIVYIFIYFSVFLKSVCFSNCMNQPSNVKSLYLAINDSDSDLILNKSCRNSLLGMDPDLWSQFKTS